MDSVHVGRRIGRTRTSRRRRTFSPTRPEALEERTLLTLSLLQNVNPVPLFPAEITGAGGNVYFVTTAADGGAELDVQTATGVTPLEDFPATIDISSLTPVGSKLFFSTNAGDGQLWVTDGTKAGTKLVKHIEAEDPTVVGSDLFFTATVSHGTKAKSLLYKSNGTAAGTVPVAMPAGSADGATRPAIL